jgi:2-polyprenyl-6-methoxyphenol hydroxylase-like FAD-dependent oxidoreductase
MTETRRALCIGGGIAGLAAAITLGRSGWEVDVVEIASSSRTVGVGLNHPANALRALRTLGLLDPVKELGWEYLGIRRYDQDGNLIAVFEPHNPGDVPFQVSMLRSDLHSLLTDAAVESGAKITYGQTWTDLKIKGRPVATFTDGSSRSYDLVVGADGIGSPVRHKLFGDEAAAEPVGYSCWRVATPRPDGVTLSETHNHQNAKVTTMILNETTMYLFLVEAFPPDYSDQRVNWSEILSAKLEHFGGIIPVVRAAIASSDQVHGAPFAEVIPRSRWHSGHVVLIGDAAHACTPHLAQGAGMAMEDAIVLADTLLANPALDAALDSFTSRRLERVRFVQDQAHAILTNEMSSDPDQKVAFAASLGARQEEITRVLAEAP